MVNNWLVRLPRCCVGVGAVCVLLIAYVSFVVAQPLQAQLPPGGMQLVAEYKHERTASIDTYSGRIWRDGGPEILYDIGTLSTNAVGVLRESNKQLWFKTVGGKHTLEAVMTDNETLYISFPGVHVNFVARRLITKTDVAEVLLMLMSFDPGKGLKEAGR